MKILSYQSTPAIGDVARNLRTIRKISEAASQLGADVAVFPELFLSGYNLGSRIREFSEAPDGASIGLLKQIAQFCGVAIVTGYPERDGKNVFNSAMAIDKHGKIIGHHRKVHLFGNEEKQNFKAGSDFSVFQLEGRQCGLCICYDIEFPEASRALKTQGAEIIFAPTANMEPYYEVPTILIPSRALENGLAIAYANLSGAEGTKTYTGLSAIIGPNGKDVACAGRHETVLFADLAPALEQYAAMPLSSQLEDLETHPGLNLGSVLR